MRFLIFIFALLVFAASAHADNRPNIVVILADDLGYGDLGVCGATDMKTPHLDKLFADGMQFKNFYANCPVCSPTRAALLTGRYQQFVGVPGVIRTHADNNWGYLDPNAIMLPQVAKDAGYQTAIVGKWHLGLESPSTPGERGFDHFHGFLGDMMDDYYDHRRHGNNYMSLNGKTNDPKGHATDLFSNWTVDYLQSAQGSKNPFLLYLAFNAPHTPIQPPKDWLEKVKLRESGITEKRAKLVALIEHMDHGIGKVLTAIEANGMLENTIVVFTSDNGGQLNVGANNGPLRDGKESVYEGGLKVPMAIRWPGKIPAGSKSALRALSMDILPTIFDMAGVKIDHNIEGRSFRRTVLGETQEPLREAMFFTRREGGLKYSGKTIDAVIRHPWKLLHNSPFQPMELYNLASDPLEETDLSKKNRKIFNQLNAQLRLQEQRGGRVSWQPQ